MQEDQPPNTTKDSSKGKEVEEVQDTIDELSLDHYSRPNIRTLRRLIS